jgi:Ice-binding-like
MQRTATALSVLRRHPVRTKLLAVTAAAASVMVFTAPAYAASITPPLGSAASFAVLGATTVTNTGFTTVVGDLGVSPGTAITGFPPGTATGTIDPGDAKAAAAQASVGTAITDASGEPCGVNLTGQDLGGMTLIPGVYCFDSSAGLTGTLKLNAQGNVHAAWLFQIVSTLTTASASKVVLINGAKPTNHCNITWLVGSSATLGTTTTFLGNILATTSITLTTGVSSRGGMYAHGGAVTMDDNHVTTCRSTSVSAG